MIGEMSLAIFFAFILSLLLLASNASLVSKFDTNNTSTPSTPCNPIQSSRGKKLETTNVLITGNSTISSPKRTFNLGFVSPGGKSSWYLAISYASIPTPPIVWVANREKPITNLTSTRLEITAEGKLAIIALPSSTVWQSTNTEKARRLLLEETGNLVLLSAKGLIVWQSFDFPTDTWLPDMNITSETSLISWRSINDPSPGLFSLRINPQGFNEFELVYNKSAKYWSTGNWTGNAFNGVPEMTIPYIYKFHFSDPFMPSASFWYTERELDGGLRPPLTRFQVGVDGQLKQYTWTQQNEYWNMFWSQPENQCRVYGLCGNLGVCNSTSLKPCVCVSGFSPDNDHDWESGDYTGGCVRESRGLCEKSDGLMEVGVVEFEGAAIVPFVGARSVCERTCLSNCSCIGLFHNGKTNLCKNLYGSLLNLRPLSSDSTFQDVLYVRVPKEGIVRKGVSKSVLLIGSIGGSVVLLGLVAGMLLIFRKRRKNGSPSPSIKNLSTRQYSLFPTQLFETASKLAGVMSRFRRVEIFEPHCAPVFLREASVFTPKSLVFPSFEEPDDLSFAALDLLHLKPSSLEAFYTATDLVKTPSFCPYKSVLDRLETDLRLQTLSDRVSELESQFDRLVNEKINGGSGAERKYTWTAEIKGPVTERKYKWTAEIRGGEEKKKKKKEEQVKNYTWTTEIKGKGEEGIPMSRKYTFETSSGFAGEGSKKEKKVEEKKKECRKEKKGACARRLVEIEDYPDHGAVVLQRAFAKRAGAVEKRKGKRKELSPQDAALLIQMTFRTYLIRRSQALRALRELAISKAKLKELRALFNNFSYRRHLARDAEERQKFSEKIIVLLLTVDAIEGAELMVRAAKRSMVDELEAMLDVVDPQPAGRSLSMRRRTFDMPDGVIHKEIAEGVAQVVQMLDNEENGTNNFEACL